MVSAASAGPATSASRAAMILNIGYTSREWGSRGSRMSLVMQAAPCTVSCPKGAHLEGGATFARPRLRDRAMDRCMSPDPRLPRLLLAATLLTGLLGCATRGAMAPSPSAASNQAAPERDPWPPSGPVDGRQAQA